MSTLFSYSDIPLPDRPLAAVPLEASIAHIDPFVYIERQAKHLQQHIQNLLDAQSEGLQASLSDPRTDDVLSTGSSTPTVSVTGVPRTIPAIPVRQPPRKKIGLRAARKGILRSMNDLLRLREEEKRVVDLRMQERRAAIKDVDTFTGKRQGLEKTISDMQNDRNGKRTEELRQEARSLEHEIEETELKLTEMKARHRQLVREISRTENAVEAKLSSYKASLSMLESEVRRYLQHPPLAPLHSDLPEAGSSFYSLNPQRRTLEMVREHWRKEQAELRTRQRGVDLEIGALEEGGPVWQSVVSEVSNFEKRLKEHMHSSIMMSRSSSEPQDGTTVEHEQAKRIIRDMDDTTHRLEEKLDLAEDKDWKLLVCSIGAELEAFNEAKTMLLRLFHLSEDPDGTSERKPSSDHIPTEGQQESLITDADGASEELVDEPPADLLRDVSSPASHPAATRSEDEDDEPDPAWLLSDP
jgi:hypothetical protein